jgi:mannose-6-phosphate isomerase-like protein (cupin superfamily)
MHPDTDELFYVVDGELEITLLLPEGAESHSVGPGTLFVVPRGIWHRPGAPAGATFFYLTPGQSLHSEADDPRRTEQP